MNASPNILFIITDQHRADAMGCAGNQWLKTPALDQLAARGTRFTQSFCVNPLCVPSRAALATSRMPHEVAAHATDYQLPADMPSLGTELRAAGYRTAWAGKWHVRSTYGRPASEDVPGFDCLVNPLLPQEAYGDAEPHFTGQAVDGGWAEAACAFLGQRHTQPFFLTLSLVNPHDVCGLVSEKKLGSYAYPDRLPALPANFATTAALQLPGGSKMSTRGYQPTWSERPFRQYLHHYYRYTEESDGLIDKVLGKLRETGLDRTTIVVYTSDHGEMGGAHHLLLKAQPYDEALRVPLIVAGPGVAAGVVDSTHLVTGLDLLPTCCGWAGRSVPGGVRGTSLAPLLAGPATSAWRDAVFLTVGTDDRVRLVRTDRYKYVRLKRREEPEVLFDLAADPGETRNCLGEPALAGVRERLRAELAKWLEATEDPFLAETSPLRTFATDSGKMEK
jgi:arylsulfatase A-like enzyme